MMCKVQFVVCILLDLLILFSVTTELLFLF